MSVIFIKRIHYVFTITSSYDGKNCGLRGYEVLDFLTSKYFSVSEHIVTHVLPSFLLLACNGLIIGKLIHYSLKRRQSLNSTNDQGIGEMTRGTFTVFLFSFLFLALSALTNNTVLH